MLIRDFSEGSENHCPTSMGLGLEVADTVDLGARRVEQRDDAAVVGEAKGRLGGDLQGFAGGDG